ncbi:c-type cytochrome biogenesis protein CcmI [Spongiibacter marinus]|uniref:c-type cytochrome biogenesis protein CcmI n=1 Tax=Spongiibacter marinus TaxID=354246 RepID=UPI00196215F0|nr:c-type cytochrome biogenesis protein CcmI [Spongiibacter marinus]MBM7423062.1 cytochrome c-type biogenesis protein CcmH [Spongiibacter marinus]
MSPLVLGVILLLALAMGLCLLAFRSHRVIGDDKAQHRQAQRDFYRQRQRELLNDREMGLISEEQMAELNAELDKQLLEENAEFSVRAGISRGPVLWLSLLLLPALALPLYDYLGYRLDYRLLDVQQQLFAADQPSEDDLHRFEALVDDILVRRPENAELLMTMASIRRQQGNYAEAAKYYERLLDLFPQDADILAQLAQARYLSANRVIDAQTRSLLERSLAVNPQQGTALGVLGIDAFAAGDYLNAITYWQRLQMGLDPQTGEAMVIAAGLNEAKRLAIEAGSIEGLQLNVDIAPALGDFPNGVLFVVVREPSGSPMPVAAVRLPVRAGTAAFPLTVYVIDSDVIRQGATLSDFDSLRVSAHISVKGVAMRSPGDWVSAAATLNGDATSQPVSLLIDQLQPATR